MDGLAVLEQVAAVVRVARLNPAGLTRAELGRVLHLGRNGVEDRLQRAAELGLVCQAGTRKSTGGRAPAVWVFNAGAGTVATASVSIFHTTLALTDLAGEVRCQRRLDCGVIAPPEEVCGKIVAALRALVAEHPGLPGVRGVGLTLPLPVDPQESCPIDPVALTLGETSPWSKFPLRNRLAAELRLPVWIDDEVDAMALAASVRPGAPADLFYLRVSPGLGLGIVSGGQVHRGNTGLAGELGHLQFGDSGLPCRCGRQSCLETVASGKAIADTASRAGNLARSPALRAAAAGRGEVTAEQVFAAAAGGDRVCVKILSDVAVVLSVVLAVLVAVYSPSEIVIGGEVARSGPVFASILEVALRRKLLPTTAARLTVRLGGVDQSDVIVGASRLACDALLTAPQLSRWIK
ncbi:MAG: ROK family protein [Bifidobacteriaceae bacterium]|nr:ROK family protein [Bifidobacteriaceae bacterium]